jgi:hypothetical protein
MERAERAALYIFFFGFGVAMLAAAGPLAFPDAPKIVWQGVFCTGIVIAILSAKFLAYEYRHVARSTHVIPLVGMITFGFGFLWPTSTGPAIAPSAEPIEGHIYIACQMGPLPLAMPQEGKFYLLPLSPSELAKGGSYIVIGERFGQPGSVIQWPSKGFQNMGVRCEIVNYTKQTLLNIDIQVKIQFTATDDNKEFGGEWRISLQKLDEGVSNKFVFYMKNETSQLIVVTFPDLCVGYVLGEDNRRTIRLAQPLGDLNRFITILPIIVKPPEADAKP